MLAVLLLITTIVQAEDLAGGLRHCASMADTFQRLACYDDLAKEAATSPSAASGRVTARGSSGDRLVIEANEAKTIGSIRVLISGQAAYQSANGGWYEGKLSCLTNPGSGCIPNYPDTAPKFLDGKQASLKSLNGYVRDLLPGPPSAAINHGISSPTSAGGYAYIAVPEVAVTGVRSFCGDASGIICYRADGRRPAVSKGCEVARVPGGCRLLGPGE